jgi:gluconate 5-dehydrogenase
MTAPDATAPAPAGPFSLAGRVALVTGASRGIGWAIAQALAASGAHVVLNGRDPATLAPGLAALAATGATAEAAPFDVTDAAQATEAVAAIGRSHGRLDILVNNAGGTARKPLEEHADADWEAVIAADLTAPFRLSREAARLMVPRRWGRILMISSINGAVARPTIPGYVAAKSGLNGLTRALAVELAPHGVCVNALAPGYFPTEGNRALRETRPGFAEQVSARTPMGRWGELYELGAAAVFLCSPGASYCTGQVLAVDGGLLASL